MADNEILLQQNEIGQEESDFQALLGDMFDAMPGGVLVWGRHGRVTAVNGEWEHTFGFSADEIVGVDAEGLNAKILPILAESSFVKEVLQGARTNPSTHKPGVCHVLPFEGREERFLECRVRRIDNGLLAGYMIEHYQNIDQLVQSGQEQHNLQKTLIQSQKLEIIGTMAAGIFHDLNNVLAIISGYSQMIRVNPAGSDQYVRKISDSCTVMEHIIKQSMDFATSDDGQFLPCDIGRIVDKSLNLLRHCIPKRIELKWEKPAELPAIKGNETQIFQLVMNLCLNASQAIDDKGAVDIKLTEAVLPEDLENSMVKAGHYIVLEVADDGCGMGEKTHNRLFNAFFSKHHAKEGRGLGLYVVQQILKLHNAPIEVRSRPGQGTHIMVHFPVDKRD